MLNENYNGVFINTAAYANVQINPELPSEPVYSVVCPECNVLVTPGEAVCPRCGTKVKSVKSKKKSKQYSYLDLAFPESGEAYRSFIKKSVFLYPLISTVVLVACLFLSFQFLGSFGARLSAAWLIGYISFLCGTVKTVSEYTKDRALFKKMEMLDEGIELRNAIIYSRQNKVHEDTNVLVGPDYIFIKTRNKAILRRDRIAAFSKNIPNGKSNVIDIYDNQGKKYTVGYPDKENYGEALFSALKKICPQTKHGSSSEIRNYIKQLHR